MMGVTLSVSEARDEGAIILGVEDSVYMVVNDVGSGGATRIYTVCMYVCTVCMYSMYVRLSIRQRRSANTMSLIRPSTWRLVEGV